MPKGGLTLAKLLVRIIMVIAGLFFLAIITQNPGHVVRERGRRVKCMNNLREIGQGCVMYASDFGGWYPTVGGPNREGRPLASLALLYGRYVTNPKLFVCPSTHDNCNDLEPGKTLLPRASTDQEEPGDQRRHCSYAYDDTRGPETKSNIVIAGDAPPSKRPSWGDWSKEPRNSDNHFGDGQNVLLYGMDRVLWITNTANPEIPGDDIYSAADPSNPGVSDSYIHQ